MILITTPVFGDLTSLNEQLPEAVRMAMGATVSRIRIELIFHRCWNLITPCGQHGTAGGAGAIALIPATAQIIKRPVLNLGRAEHDLAQ